MTCRKSGSRIGFRRTGNLKEKRGLTLGFVEMVADRDGSGDRFHQKDFRYSQIVG